MNKLFLLRAVALRTSKGYLEEIFSPHGKDVELRRHLEGLREANDVLLHSHSWRITASLRAIMRFLRGSGH